MHSLTPSAPSTPSAHRPTPDARFWDRMARDYARSPIDDPEGYERTLTRVGALLTMEDDVLELGCGTGSTALRLAPKAGSWLATDISTEMITIAREKLSASPTPGLRLEAAVAEGIQPPEGGFDVIVGFNYLHLVADLPATLARIHAMLRPGGRFISKTACVAELNVFIRMAIPLMRLVGKAPATVAVFDEATLVAAIAEAGFVVEQVERHGAKGKDVRAFVIAARPVGPSR